jgi:hypothetical protein
MMEMERVRESAIERRRVYRRELPGAGYVAIDVCVGDVPTAYGEGMAEGDPPRVRIYVERRASEGRRLGHEPPVLAEIDGDDSTPAVGELYRMAADNVALARALLEWQTRRQKDSRDD